MSVYGNGKDRKASSTLQPATGLDSVREVERQTGLDFYSELPKEVQDQMEAVKAERLW